MGIEECNRRFELLQLVHVSDLNVHRRWLILLYSKYIIATKFTLLV